MHLEDWLDDLCVRFIINLPQEDLSSVERICFAVEEAQWYYEDFIRPLDPSLPSMSLRNFCIRIFAHCPLLSTFSQGDHMQAFESFIQYKLRIPVRGAIMLNEAMDSAVLVKGWKKGANWSFPRGKINKDEDDLACAIREVYEETGFDLETAGLVPEDRKVKFIDMTIRDQDMRLYLFRGVPTDTHFEPKTRKEISKIQWWRISDLPSFQKKGQQADAAVNANKFYMVAPFIRGVRKWAIEQKRLDSTRAISSRNPETGMGIDEFMTDEDQGAETNSQDPASKNSSTHDINQLETALKVALRIQPPTEGLQPEAISAIHSPVRDSGQELLALLQGRARASNQPTPLGSRRQTPHRQIANTQAALQQIPYQQHSRQLYFANESQLPTFSVQSSALNYSDRVPVQPPYRHSHIARTQPQPQSQWAQEHPHSHQPQHLIHPQPLPPHVQKTLFAEGPTNSQRPPQPPQQPLDHQVPKSQLPNVTPSMQDHNAFKPTSHSLALLDALKNRNETKDHAVKSGDSSLRSCGQAIGHAPPQELPAEVSVATHVDLVSLYKAQPRSLPVYNPNTMKPGTVTSQEHRSSLLNLFKAPPNSSEMPKSVTATVLPTSTTPSAVELSAVEPLSSNAPSGPALTLDERILDREAKGSISELYPKATLPSQEFSTLTHPSQENSLGNGTRNGPSQSSRPYDREAAGNHTTTGQFNYPPKSPSQPRVQILKRPQPDVLKPAGSPHGPTFSGLTGQPSFDRRSSQTADHRQTLLSLFGKSPSAPDQKTNLIGNGFESPQTVAPVNVPPKTGVKSLASDGLSRPGSQTLSAADKSFLLNYLDNVAKGTQQ